MSIQVNDFKWEKGKNDLKYIELLEKTLETQKRITNEVVAKIKTLAAENAKLEKDLKNKKNKIAVNKERLTAKNETDTAYYFPLCFEKCDGLGASRKCDTCDLIYNVCEKLGEYEELEEQGLLLRLPCKVGDTVWELCKCNDNVYRIFPMVVKQVIPNGSVRWIKDKEPTVWNIYAISDYTDMYKAFCDFGKTVFLTQSEAEEKLGELEE